MMNNSDTQAVGLLLVCGSMVPAGFRILGTGSDRFLFTRLIDEWTRLGQAASASILVGAMIVMFVAGAALFMRGVVAAREHRRRKS